MVDVENTVEDVSQREPEEQPPRISLIGYRGTGKSTVARIVAARLGWSWVDADDEIECRAGKSIKEIFASAGEPAFRDWEAEVVRDLLQRTEIVVALGGGAVLRAPNRRALRGSWVVWLTADPHTILRRIAEDPLTADRRPNLTTAGGIQEIERLLGEREPLYRECADCVVSTVGKTPEQVADEIVCLRKSRTAGVRSPNRDSDVK